MRDNDYQATIFAGTTAGLQAAIDYLAGGKGKVSIGPGTLEITTVISIHSNCHLHGCGPGMTVIKRATGSLGSGDAAYSGNTILTTAYGSNGTPPSSSANSQSNIVLSDLTLDGNASAFGAVTISSQNHFGVRAFWTDGLTISNVEIKEFLQNGAGTDCCKNVKIDNLKVYHAGQYGSASSKNSLVFNNTQLGEAAGFNQFYTVTNFISDSPGDEHIDLVNVSDVTVTNMVCNGGERVIELEGDSTNATGMSRISFSNVMAINHTEEFFANSITGGIPLTHVSLVGCHGVAASGHVQDCLSITGTSDQLVSDFSVSKSTFENYNDGDASGISTVLLTSTSASTSGPVTIEDCVFRPGNTASTRTNCHGIEVACNLKGLTLRNVRLYTIAGLGVYIHPGTDQVVRDGSCSNVIVDTSNHSGFLVAENNSTNGTIKNMVFTDCLSIDANRQTGNQAFQVGAVSAAGGGVVQYISFIGCRAYKNSGTNPLRGLDFQDGAGGTTDNIIAVGCDFNTLTAPYNSGGSPTNVRVSFLPGRGSDIASAATIAIPTNGSVFHVTGTTNITNGITVNVWDNGRTVVLIFDGILTVSDTGTSVLSAALVTTANDTLTLSCDGTNWYEVARSAN